VGAPDGEFQQSPVSMSDISHAAYGSQGKLYNNQNIQKSISQVKESQSERTPKANAPSLPGTAPPLSFGDSPTRATVQRSVPATAASHPNRQTLPMAASTTPTRPSLDDIPATEDPPLINVTPSSPLSLTSVSRAAESPSLAESAIRTARESANERRANRRRSAVDVCISFLCPSSCSCLRFFLNFFFGATGHKQSPLVRIFLQFIASPRTGRGASFIEPSQPSLNFCETILTFIARSRRRPQSSPHRTITTCPGCPNLD
jgi:hypothetical protein